MPLPEEMDPVLRRQVLCAADQIGNWVKAVQQYEHDRAMAGDVAEGFKLVAKRAIRRWKDGDDAVDTLRIELGLDDDELYERKLLSPSKLERHFPGKNSKERQKAMEPLVVKESSGLNLVPIDDPRPAAKVDAAQEFGE